MVRGSSVRSGGGLVLLAIVIALAAAAPAWGGESAKAAAKRHYEKGLKLYTQSEFAGARDEFQAARELVDAPQFLFNLAQCARNLGDHDEAIALYEKFLERMPAAPNRAKVDEYLASERALIAPRPVPAKPKVEEPPKIVAPLPPPPPPPATPPPPSAPKPAWQRAWLWIVVGGAVVAAAGISVGLALGLSGTSGTELGVHDLGLRF
jgi:tetratricopeptide (TPR) repeat protein